VLMAWRRRDVRAHARAIRGEQRYRRLRVRRDVVVEALLDWLAARWPDRFGDAASRFRDARGGRRDEAAPAAIDAASNVIALPGRRP
jgi:type IV secretion system protein VirD4